MIVDVENQTYKIGFEHITVSPDSKKRKRHITLAKLYFDSGMEEPKRWQLIGIERAKCSRQDNFCKATGRKIALTRLLGEWFHDNKDTRRAVWNKYWNR